MIDLADKIFDKLSKNLLIPELSPEPVPVTVALDWYQGSRERMMRAREMAMNMDQFADKMPQILSDLGGVSLNHPYLWMRGIIRSAAVSMAEIATALGWLRVSVYLELLCFFHVPTVAK